MYWNGSHWTDERAAILPVPPTSRRRFRDILATVPILLLVPALVFPFLSVGAGSITPTPGEPTITLTPAWDAQVKSSSPATNYGSLTSIRTREDPVPTNATYRTYLTFDVTGVTGTVTSVKLRLFATDASPNTQSVSAVDPGAWAEGTLNWNNKPVFGSLLGSAAVPTLNAYNEISLPTSVISGDGPISFGIMSDNTNSAIFSSKEAASNPPQLVITQTASGNTAPTANATSKTMASDASGLASALYSANTVKSLPTSGSAWDAMKSQADKSLGTPNLSDQNDSTDIYVLAAGLVYARTGDASYRTKAITAIKQAVGTERGGRTLALGRNLSGYILAANLVDLPGAEPAFNEDTFKPWLRSLLTETLDGDTLRSTHEQRPNNWGTHAGASRVAIALYLGDAAELSRAAAVFHGWLGDRSAYAGFSYGDLSWQCDASKPVGINPAGCTKNGQAIGGALPEEMRRGGTFAWPPAPTDYAWEGLQGAVLQAELLRRAGYDAWKWEDKALLRAAKFLYGIGWPAVGDDEWQPWLIDARYGTSYRGAAPAHFGKSFGWTDWLYGS